MSTIIVDQFNPTNGYWNKLYEVDSADFDPDASITVNKYGGPYRTRTVGEDVIPLVIEDNLKEKVEVVFEDELEEDPVEVVEEDEDPPKFDDRGW